LNSDSRTHNSARNLTMSVIQKIVSIILTFIGRQIFLRVLTVEYLGINGLFANVLSLLSLADLGMATAMSFSFYRPLADKDEDKLTALIGFYRKVYIIIAAFVAAAGLVLTPFLRYIINLENDIPNIEVYYLIALANTVISYLFVYKSTIITADQNSSIVTKYAVWVSLLTLLLQIAVLLTAKNFMAYCLVSVFTTLLNNLLISRKANRMYPFIKRKIRLDAADRKGIFLNIRSMFIYKVASFVYKGTDNIFISAMIGTAIVGKYENYNLAVTSLSAIAFMMFNSLTPSLGNLIAREKPESRMQVFRVMQTLSYWIGGFLGFCLFFLLDDFVVLWLGRSFIFDVFTKIAILLNFYLSITLYPITAFREATGIYRKTKYAMVAAAVLKILFSVLMGYWLGLAGIVLATTVSRLLTYAWYEPKVLFRDYLGGSAAGYLLGHLLNLALLSGCIAAAYFLFPIMKGSGWMEWCLKGVVYTLGINVVYILRFHKAPELRVIAEKVKDLRRR